MLTKKFLKSKDECEVTFEFAADAAGKVALVSEATGWQPLEMKKRKKDGVFYAKVRLPESHKFQYRYLLDGQTWVNDPAADAYVPNEFGSHNGIVDTTPTLN
ncbi:MAG: isoamylase early set domain-containing protein [Chloroflexi bacterium]|nr:isoamylase early set domain-containing protein [Chloroflexota bacterium]MCI0576768.1 isoamylase early set domain-containing protein [Chloroflexota bacterium]MCI0645970.1 isoamylase early set domain-containing protein [Chloroflexota bacterium]MCI0731482.1 isoamylase early set domain-containing protein [Chloroflexota bacterium]